MRVELFHDRSPDYECGMQLFIDGAQVTFTEYSIDPGAGHYWHDWIASRAYDIVHASPAVAALIRQEALLDSPYIDGMPHDMTQRERDLADAIEHQRAHGLDPV